MTFGLIGEVFGTIGEMLGYQRSSDVFLPDWCQLLKEGERHPHILHSSKTDDKSRTYLINTQIDLQMISMEYMQTMGETMLSQQKQINDMHEFQEQQFKKLRKSLKSFSFSRGEGIDVLERLDSKLKELSKKISTLEKAMKSNDKVADQLEELKDRSDNTKVNKAVSTATKKIEGLESLLKEVDKQVKAQSKASQSLTPEVIQENLGIAFKKQDKQISRGLEELQSRIKELLDEVKFDPDNPKPTEVRTEENSKSILDISNRLLPLIEDCQKAINNSNELLERLRKRI